jgi:hypothetical protein
VIVVNIYDTHGSFAMVHDAYGPGPPGRLSTLSVFHSRCILYGVFVWARRALDRPERWFRARAVRLVDDRGPVGAGGNDVEMCRLALTHSIQTNALIFAALHRIGPQQWSLQAVNVATAGRATTHLHRHMLNHSHDCVHLWACRWRWALEMAPLGERGGGGADGEGRELLGGGAPRKTSDWHPSEAAAEKI